MDTGAVRKSRIQTDMLKVRYTFIYHGAYTYIIRENMLSSSINNRSSIIQQRKGLFFFNVMYYILYISR